MSIRLLNGDCLALMKDLSANSVDLIICDLPYGCLSSQTYKGVTDKSGSDLGKTYGEKITWDIKIDLKAFWTEAKRILRNEHSPVIHFCTTKFGFELYNSNPDWFRYDLVWDKQRGVSFLQANKMPMRSHEMIYVFSAKGAFYNRVDEDAPGKKKRTDNISKPHKANVYTTPNSKLTRSQGADENKSCVKTVIQIQKIGTFKQGHPTEKPVALYRWLIERYCPLDGTILDPTFGSCNSCFTAQAMGRHAIGMEKDKGFYDKAIAKIIPPTNEIISD